MLINHPILDLVVGHRASVNGKQPEMGEVAPVQPKTNIWPWVAGIGLLAIALMWPDKEAPAETPALESNPKKPEEEEKKNPEEENPTGFPISKEIWNQIEKFLKEEAKTVREAEIKFNMGASVINKHFQKEPWYQEKFGFYTQEDWDKIEKFLKEEAKTVAETARKFNVLADTIQRHFQKEPWYQEKFGHYTQEDWDKIEKFLKEEAKTVKEAARKFNIVVTAIQNHFVNELWYQEKFSPYTQEEWNEIEKFLKEEAKSVSEAARKFNIHYTTIQHRFNKEPWYQEKFGKKRKPKYELHKAVFSQIITNRPAEEIRKALNLTRTQLDNIIKWIEAAFISGDINLMTEHNIEGAQISFDDWKKQNPIPEGKDGHKDFSALDTIGDSSLHYLDEKLKERHNRNAFKGRNHRTRKAGGSPKERKQRGRSKRIKLPAKRT